MSKHSNPAEFLDQAVTVEEIQAAIAGLPVRQQQLLCYVLGKVLIRKPPHKL